MCCGDPNIVSIVGEKGDSGNSEWMPLFAAVNDGDRIVRKIIGWYGGTGNVPPYTNFYEGATGWVADISEGTNIKGPQGDTGETGVGLNGWTAVTANVADDDRIVQQIVDWFGGDGTKPSTGGYISPLGITSDISLATDIRGPQGPQGPQGDPGVDITNGRVKITEDDTTLGFLSESIVAGGLVKKSVETPGGNEKLNLTVNSPITGIKINADYSPVETTPTTITGISYTTPNDGITRTYQFVFSAIATIAVIDGTDRSAVMTYGFYLNGVSQGYSTVIGCFSKSGTSRPERGVSLSYVIESIPPNTTIEVKCFKDPGDGGQARSRYNTMTIFGI